MISVGSRCKNVSCPMLQLLEKQTFVARLPLCALWRPTQVAALAHALTRRAVARGEVLHARGAPFRRLAFVLSGEVRVTAAVDVEVPRGAIGKGVGAVGGAERTRAPRGRGKGVDGKGGLDDGKGSGGGGGDGSGGGRQPPARKGTTIERVEVELSRCGAGTLLGDLEVGHPSEMMWRIRMASLNNSRVAANRCSTTSRHIR